MKKSTNNQCKINDSTKKIELLMPKEVKKKIDFLCKTISEVEWSGILLYSTEGSIKSPESMKITLRDIIPMDKGSSVYTEFSFTEKKRDGSGYEDKHIDYCEIYPEAMEYQIGLIHSHNNMNTFFSATDMTELQDNCPLHNYYLSLIVNNAGDYEAKIAISTSGKSLYSLDFTALDEDGKEFIIKTSELSVEKTSMLVYDCNITVEAPQSSLELDMFMQNVVDILSKSGNIDYTTRSKISQSPINPFSHSHNPWIDPTIVNTSSLSKEECIEDLDLEDLDIPVVDIIAESFYDVAYIEESVSDVLERIFKTSNVGKSIDLFMGNFRDVCEDYFVVGSKEDYKYIVDAVVKELDVVKIYRNPINVLKNLLITSVKTFK